MSGPGSSGQPSKAPLRQHLRVAIDAAPLREAVINAACALLTPEQMSEVAADRMIVEQVKGMMMVIYDVDADHAFEMLKGRSKTTKVKLSTLAGQLASEFRSLSTGDGVPSRAHYDDVLRTAHQRIASERAGSPSNP